MSITQNPDATPLAWTDSDYQMCTRTGIFALIVLAGTLAGCATANPGGDRVDQGWITAVIIGSAETPDPVLVWVRNLEREGKVRDVVVMESFPVRIRLTAPQQIVDELEVMKRKLPPDPL